MGLTLIENCFRAQGGLESRCSPCSQEEMSRGVAEEPVYCRAGERESGKQWLWLPVSGETTLTGSESHGLTAQEGMVSCVWMRNVVQERWYKRQRIPVRLNQEQTDLSASQPPFFSMIFTQGLELVLDTAVQTLPTHCLSNHSYSARYHAVQRKPMIWRQ